jgi:hypothetical protein
VADEATIQFGENGPRARLSVDVEKMAPSLFVETGDGLEHHFGRGPYSKPRHFTYVASYNAEGRDQIYWAEDLFDSIAAGASLLEGPILGPMLPPLVKVALENGLQGCSKHKGFVGYYEKEQAVKTLRWLHEVAREPFDPEEVQVWVATNGWALDAADRLAKIADEVRQGVRHRTGQRTITVDHEVGQHVVEHWRQILAERGS